MMPVTEEHRIGALIFALTALSGGDYLLIRTGRKYGRGERQWRASMREKGKPYGKQIDATGPTLRASLESLILKRQGVQ